MLWRKWGQPELLHEPEERPHGEWVLLPRQAWGPRSDQASQWALSTLLAVVAGRGKSYTQTKRMANVHISPGSPGKKTSLVLPSRSCLSLSQPAGGCE